MAKEVQHDHSPGSGWAQRFADFLRSPLFFWLLITLFALQAAWIALCARYPQAFDEQFHFGLIQVYSHHLSPFLSSQPLSSDQFGAMYRDPSYLYHYLMSFPYRLIIHITGSFTTQIIILRFVNIALFVSGLLLFRKVFRAVGASAALTNVGVAFLALTPVMPLLASQITYDNLLFPLSGGALLLAIRVVKVIGAGEKFPWSLAALLLLVGMLDSLVKYAFLPIFAALLIVILIATLRSRTRFSLAQGFKDWVKQPKNILLILAISLSFGLFWQRYGINTLRYHTPTPECDQVLNVQRCEAYSPWARNYMFEQQHITLGLGNIVSYPFIWLYHSIGELIFTISSNYNDAGTVDYHVGSQLILIEVVAWTVFGIGMVLIIWQHRRLFANPIIRLFALVILIYVAALFAQNLSDYLHLGIPVAIHGRYLLPVLPLIYVIFALAFKYGLEGMKVRGTDVLARKAWLAAVMGALLLLEGGGFTTYILRSNPSWFWPQSSKAQSANDKVRKVLKHTVIDTNH